MWEVTYLKLFQWCNLSLYQSRLSPTSEASIKKFEMKMTWYVILRRVTFCYISAKDFNVTNDVDYVKIDSLKTLHLQIWRHHHVQWLMVVDKNYEPVYK